MRNITFTILLLLGARSLSQECPPSGPEFSPIVETDDFWIEVQGSDGAVGDVVPVTLTLTSRLVNPEFLSSSIALCHDPDVAELVGAPVFHDELASMLTPGGLVYVPIADTPGAAGDPRGHGFFSSMLFQPLLYRARFPSEVPLSILTLYYRLKGNVGQETALTFCDATLEIHNARCLYNHIRVSSVEDRHGKNYVSQLNKPGHLTILDGPTTRPNRPPTPPEARIYSERPTPAEVNYQVRITGAHALPGSKDVPVTVEVSVALEYSAIQIPIDFDEQYLRLVRTERTLSQGVIVINNHENDTGPSVTEGYAVVVAGLGSSTRRLGTPGEVIEVATLYFDVLEAAAEIESTPLSVVAVGPTQFNYQPWVGVHFQDGSGVDAPIVRAEIAPIVIRNGVLGLRGPPQALLGDANFDNRVDISDPILVLNFLFRPGEPPACPSAADYNRDGRLDISDPIGILRALFLGATIPEDPALGDEVACE